MRLMSRTLELIATVFILLAVASVALSRLLNAKPSIGGSASDYHARIAVFSAAERSFLGVLEGVLPDGVTWMGKIRLGDVFVTRKGLTPSRRSAAWNRINQKHVDFLLVSMRDFVPLAGIELDDKSHEEDDRKRRDAFVDEVFRSSSVPLLHIAAQAAYNAAELRAKITALLARP